MERPDLEALCRLRPDDRLLLPYRIGEEYADQTSPMRDLGANVAPRPDGPPDRRPIKVGRSEEHTSELQSRLHLVCRLLLEKKKKKHLTSNCNQMLSVLCTP